MGVAAVWRADSDLVRAALRLISLAPRWPRKSGSGERQVTPGPWCYRRYPRLAQREDRNVSERRCVDRTGSGFTNPAAARCNLRRLMVILAYLAGLARAGCGKITAGING
jgi:hypothetical protein